MRTNFIPQKQTSADRSFFFSFITFALCLNLLIVSVGMYLLPCRLTPPQSPCRFQRGRFLRMLGGVLTETPDVRQLCDDAWIGVFDDVSLNLVTRIPDDIRHYADIRIQDPPSYLQNLSFLC